MSDLCTDDSCFKLMALLAVPSVPEAADALLVECVRRGVEPKRLQALLEYHRVIPAAAAKPLVGLMPSGLCNWLKTEQQQGRRKALRQFQTQVSVSRALAAAGIRHRFFKGLSLAELLYRDISLRHAQDVDLIIERAALAEADRLLVELGYLSSLAGNSAELPGNKLALSMGKDLAYCGQGLPKLEVHWRVDNAETAFCRYYSQRAFFLPSDKPSVEEFVYLCWHAGQSLYHRFKWLVDIDAYLRLAEQRDDSFQEKTLTLAREYDVDRYVLLAIELLRLSFPWHAERKPSLAKPLVRRIAGRIVARWRVGEPGCDKVRMMLDRFHLIASWRDRCCVAGSLLFRPTDAARDVLNRCSGWRVKPLQWVVPIFNIAGYIKR